MKYMRKYVEGLSKDFKTTESNTSQSVYVTLDGGFSVRVSDHLPLVTNEHNLYIIKCFNEKDRFAVVRKGTPYLMIKDRRKTREYIAMEYENFTIDRLVKEHEEAVKKHEIDKIAQDGNATKGDVELAKLLLKYRSSITSKNWAYFAGALGKVGPWYKLSDSVKKTIRLYYTNSLTSGMEIIKLLFDFDGDKRFETKEGTMEIFEGYIKGRKKKLK